MKKAALLATSILAIAISSCNDSKFDGFTKAENGLHYKFFNHDESGTKIQKGDGIIFRYIITNQKNDSIIVDSKNVSEDGTGYVKFLMGESTFKGSFEDGMMMMAKGDSAEFIVSADSFFLKTNRANELPKGIMPGDNLKGVFKIKDIKSKKELEQNQKMQQAEQEAKERQVDSMAKVMEPQEKPAIEKYVKENNIKVKPTASGLYYIETQKGTGPSPKPTDVVKVAYVGTLLDGTEFDNSDKHGGTVEFPVNQVIPGWTEALQLMRKGGKAKLLIPSAIAYGPRGGGPIPPYSPLVFNLELVDIMPAAEQPQGPGAQPGH